MHEPSRAIEATLVRSKGLIRAAAFRAGIDSGEIDELLQDLRIRLWRAFDRPGENRESLPASYIYKATMSAAIDFLRRRRTQRRRNTIPIEMVADTLIAREDASASGVQMMEALGRALARLRVDRRVAVRLHLEGKDREAIADFTGWSPARTRNLLYRGLDDLRNALREEAS